MEAHAEFEAYMRLGPGRSAVHPGKEAGAQQQQRSKLFQLGQIPANQKPGRPRPKIRLRMDQLGHPPRRPNPQGSAGHCNIK